MSAINQQTPGPLFLKRDGVLAERATGALVATLGFRVHVGSTEDEANARLLAAGFNAFDAAGRKLGIDAAELAESIDLVAAYQALELVRTMARMIIDGDVIDGREFSADGNDDEVDAFYTLISDARELVPDRPAGLEE